MRAWFAILPLALAGTGACAAANSPFNGKWVADLGAQTEADHIDVYLVANGQYRCASCRPPRAYPADGVTRPVSGDPNITAESVNISGPRSITTHMVEPDMVRDVTMTVEPDDRTATYVALDRWPGRDRPLRTVLKAERVKPAPRGAHPVSGSWKATGYTETPEAYRTVELKLKGERLSVSDFRGGHFTALFDGPAATIEGAANNRYQAAVKRIDENSFQETVLSDGRPVSEITYTLSSDGQSLTRITKDLDARETFASTYYRK